MGKRRGYRLVGNTITDTELKNLMIKILTDNAGIMINASDMYGAINRAGYLISRKRVDLSIPHIVGSFSGVDRIRDDYRNRWNYFVRSSGEVIDPLKFRERPRCRKAILEMVDMGQKLEDIAKDNVSFGIRIQAKRMLQERGLYPDVKQPRQS